jgi:hypothetical protein
MTRFLATIRSLGTKTRSLRTLFTILCAAILCMMKAYPQISCLLRVTTWF